MTGYLTALTARLKNRFPLGSNSGMGNQLGIYVSEEYISLAEVVRENDTPPRLSLFSVAPCSNSANRLTALKELVEKHALQRKHAVVVLQADEYLLEQIEAPDVDDKEILKSLKWRIKDLLNFPLEQATIDYLDMPDQGQQHLVYAVAAKSPLILERRMLLEDAGLIPAAVDISDLALTNLAPLYQNHAEDTVATLYFDQSFGIITFSRGKTLYLSRRLDYGLQTLIESEPSKEELATIKRDKDIMDSTPSPTADDVDAAKSPDPLTDITYSDNLLEQDPREFSKMSSPENPDHHLLANEHSGDSLSLSTEGWSADSLENDPFSLPLDPLATPMEDVEEDARHHLIDDIQRSVDYFNQKHPQHPVAQCLIVPIQQHAPYFLEQLNESLEMTVQEMNLGKQLQYFGYIYDEHKISASLAIGAALRQTD